MTNDATIDFLLAFADDEHFMGQQHTEWIGVAPFLEEDLAFSSIGQDELGHAAMLYERVLELQDGVSSPGVSSPGVSSPGVSSAGSQSSARHGSNDLAIDRLAYRRADHDYRSSAFVEFPTNEWAQALVRHWIYDTIEVQRWSFLERSSDEALQAIAASALREETYHRLHADALLDPLLADHDGRARLLQALDTIAPLVASLLTPTAGETELLASGLITGSMSQCTPEIERAISERFEHEVSVATWAWSTPDSEQHDRTQRSAHFEPLMSRMREVLDFDPNAVW